MKKLQKLYQRFEAVTLQFEKLEIKNELFDDNIYKRHTCIICKRKRYELYMKQVLFSSWACKDKYYFQVCSSHSEIRLAEKIREDLKKLKIINIKHIVSSR
jgi:hypothetical protein